MAGKVSFAVGPVAAGEWEVLRPLLARALHFSEDALGAWVEQIGVTNFRAVRVGGRAVGGLGWLPLAQRWGGASVGLAGITAVGIAPEWRGRGAASALLRAALAELRGNGTPLAALYPSTFPVYRKAGFERAASLTVYDLPLAILDPRGPLEVVAAPAHDPAIVDLYARSVAGRNGALDRHPFNWWRVFAPIGREALAFRFERDGAAEGYVVYAQGGREEPLEILDWACLTRDAARTLLAFLAGHRAMVASARLRGGPQEALFQLLPEPRAIVARRNELLLRIVDLPAALAARGYPPHLDMELHLAVADSILPENDGRFVLRVAGGRGAVERGGAGTLQIGIRALASLYSGFLTPHDLAGIGDLVAPPADLARAAAIFGGPSPWLADMF